METNFSPPVALTREWEVLLLSLFIKATKPAFDCNKSPNPDGGREGRQSTGSTRILSKRKGWSGLYNCLTMDLASGQVAATAACRGQPRHGI